MILNMQAQKAFSLLFTVLVLSHVQSCPALCNPMGYSPPGSCVLGILQARILEWLATSFSRGYSQPRDQTRISYVSCIGRQVLYHQCHLGSPFCSRNYLQLSGFKSIFNLLKIKQLNSAFCLGAIFINLMKINVNIYLKFSFDQCLINFI